MSKKKNYNTWEHEINGNVFVVTGSIINGGLETKDGYSIHQIEKVIKSPIEGESAK